MKKSNKTKVEQKMQGNQKYPNTSSIVELSNEMGYNLTIADFIRELEQLSRLTLSSLCKLCKVQPSDVCHWRTGERRVDDVKLRKLYKQALALDKDVMERSIKSREVIRAWLK